MGKLHTIRRAIERDPEKWYTIDEKGTLRVKAAKFYRQTGQWEPYQFSWYDGASYMEFVAHVVQGILNERERRKNSPR